ncbi:MAG: CMP-N-acetylneuraminic acid synthetase [Parasphingorhabdus sp.]
MTIIAVIPARGGSKRLHRKNIYPVFGKPMLAWSIEACKRSKYLEDVYVSTEDDEIANVALMHNAKVISRPNELSDDNTPKMEAIRHADEWYQQAYGNSPDILVSVQANSPELNAYDIDRGITMLLEHNLFEVISVGENLIQNASFRVIRQTCLHNTYLSAHLGVVINDCKDVHTLEDVKAIEASYKSASHFVQRINN